MTECLNESENILFPAALAFVKGFAGFIKSSGAMTSDFRGRIRPRGQQVL